MYADPLGVPEHVKIASWPDDPTWAYEKERPQRYEKERLQVRDFQGWLRLLAEKYPARGKLVEVGSSLGYLLEACRHDGWDVTGIEPDINGCKHATSLGLHSIHSVLEEARLPSGSTDVVIILHVIEHVPNPLGTLREIYRILKPGGRAIVETPRYDSLMFRLLGRRERSLRCNGHVYFFTTKTLRLACQEAGFVVERTEYPARTLTLDRLAYNLTVIACGGRSHANEFSRRMRMQNRSVRINLRDIQRVLLMKPSAPGA